MPKNTKGGKKYKRSKTGDGDDQKELVFKTEGQEYAKVIKMLGDRRVEVQTPDNETMIAHIRGNMRKRVWINVGDLVLLAMRDFQDNKADIILKYSNNEEKKLSKYGEVTHSFIKNTLDEEESDSDDLIFEDADDIGVDDI